MPGTTFYIIPYGSPGLSSLVNANFDFLEGSIMPATSTTPFFTTSVYDLGSATYKWKTGYFEKIILGSTTLTAADESTIGLTNGAFMVKDQGVRGSTANAGGSQREISQGTISTPDIRANALKNSTQSASGSLATGSTITTVQVTTEGEPVLIMASVSLRMDSDLNGLNSVTFSVDRNGTGVTGAIALSYLSSETSTSDVHSVRFAALDNPGAGTYSYNLRQTINNGTNAALLLDALDIVRMKR